MRVFIVAVAALGLLVSTASADTMKNCSAAWSGMAPADKAKSNYPAFSKMCLAKGYSVASMAVPAGATGKCKDGTYTKQATHSGACSGHGGVASWLPGH
ncbi:MAG TPA: DUF3761 domain-containing protein [Rhizomicrobium sp.]|nr:DUF3761 domain-containing protein [Rhizomicrobium sp.]